MKLPKTSAKFIQQYMKITTTARPKSNHYYLVCIGVNPMHQKSNYGRNILNHIHEIVDEDPYSTGIGLDTENLVNVEIYKKFGYELVSETPIDEITIYCMFRKNKKNNLI